MQELRARIIGIARHRLLTDGDGVTTLAAFHGCPLRCRYCLNPQSFGREDLFKEYTPESLYREVAVDELYFLATGGGVTFGGGEPCLHPQFIADFRALCGPEWHINVETSLHVPTAHIEALLPVVDTFIIDIKDWNPEIYRRYTQQGNDLVVANLHLLAERQRQSDCFIRLPLIPEYNTEADRQASRAALEEMGFTRFDPFTYQIRRHGYDTRKADMPNSEGDSPADCRSQ